MIGAALVLALAACGGGSSGTPVIGPGPSPSPAGSFRPANNGDTFHYGGTLVQTFWRPVQPGPSGAPSPVPTSTTSWSVDNLTTVATNATFHGTTGLTDFAENEVDTGLQTISSVTDDYFVFPAGGNGPLAEDGFRSIDSNFVLDDVQRGAGSGVVDMLPDTSGSSWRNSAQLVSVEADPDGQTSTRLVNADGSYSEADVFPDGTFSSAVANADGSGFYRVLKGSPIETDYNYSAPAGGKVSITITMPGASPVPSPVVVTVPNWQPAGGLASDAYVDQGVVTIPAACGLPAKFGTSGFDVAEHRTATDPIFGTIEDVTAHAYVVQGRGVVCAVRHDSVTAYYDFSGQNGLAFFAGTPLQYTIIDETLGLRTESVLSGLQRRPSVLAARGALRLVNVMRLRAARAIRATTERTRVLEQSGMRARRSLRRNRPA